MRKINDKDFSAPPPSLESKKTGKMRMEIIRLEKYPDQTEKYNKRYKMKDIKETLRKIYNKKCAYCEQSINDTYVQIEHYRPKSIYYWLAYSWDNLFLCCEKCNKMKGDKFEIEAEARVKFTGDDLNDIHNLTPGYSKAEKPLMINPELEDIEDKLIFDIETGHIRSDDYRCRYTIDCCRLYRGEANSNRKKIWDDFYKKVKAIFYDISILKEQFEKEEIASHDFENRYKRQCDRLNQLIKYFRQDAYNPDNDYLAFRKYIVKKHDLFVSRN